MSSLARPIRDRSMLVADPDPDTRALYRQLLSHTGWRLDEAEDGRDALAKALTQPPELLITETRLPLLDGYTLCELLRTDPVTAAILILVVTGDAFPTQVQRARRAGADSVLVKPCAPDGLLREISHVGDDRSDRRVRTAPANTVVPNADAARLVLRPATPHVTEVPVHNRFSARDPRVTPPQVRCPFCDGWLQYRRSHGGVNQARTEQYDYFECPAGCGVFEYRQRTGRLRMM